MKIRFIGGLVFVCLMMASCTKSVKVETTEITGLLEGAFTAVAGEYEAMEDGEDLVVTIPIKRTNQTVPYTAETISVFSKDTKDAKTFAGFGYEMFDENGTKTGEVAAKDNDSYPESQLAVLNLDKDKTGELKIKFKKGSVPPVLKITSDLQFVNSGDIVLNGTVDKTDVQGLILNLNFQDSKLSGRYNVGSSEINLTGDIKKVTMEYGNFVFDVSLSESKGGASSYTVNCPIKLTRDGAMDPYRYVLIGDYDINEETSIYYDLSSEPL